MKICKIDECNSKHYGLGFCKKHYKRFKKHGNPLYINPRYDHSDICKVDGCNEKYMVKGYCIKHYTRFRRYGDPLHTQYERHGMREISEYGIWVAIKQRCYNPKHKSYHRYGGRGIMVCDRWLNSFLDFFEDMGLKPFIGAQIDRIDNDGNYEPGNCRWVTAKENMNNRNVTKLNRNKKPPN